MSSPFVVEALRVLVDDDAEDHAVVARDDAAVVFRRARIDRDRMALGRIAGLGDAAVEQHFQHRAAVVRRAADQEVVRRRPPVLLEPLDVRLKPAAGRDQRCGAHRMTRAALLNGRGEKHAIVDLEIDHLRLIGDLDAERLGGQIERVEHRAPAAEEERVGAAEAQGAAERRLIAHALLRQPVEHGLGLGDHVARQRLVGMALRDLRAGP